MTCISRCVTCRKKIDFVSSSPRLVGILCAECGKQFCLPHALRHFIRSGGLTKAEAQTILRRWKNGYVRIGGLTAAERIAVRLRLKKGSDL